MRNFVILIGELLCLFGPTALLTFIGYRSIENVGKRPTQSGKLMVALITKLSVMAFVLINILMILLFVYTKK